MGEQSIVCSAGPSRALRRSRCNRLSVCPGSAANHRATSASRVASGPGSEVSASAGNCASSRDSGSRSTLGTSFGSAGTSDAPAARRSDPSRWRHSSACPAGRSRVERPNAADTSGWTCSTRSANDSRPAAVTDHADAGHGHKSGYTAQQLAARYGSARRGRQPRRGRQSRRWRNDTRPAWCRSSSACVAATTLVAGNRHGSADAASAPRRPPRQTV